MRRPIPVAEPNLGPEEEKYLLEAIRSGWISRGKFVDQLEEQFAAFCGTKFALSTCNGTAALHLALHSLGVSQGDEVIVPALTFVATANAVLYTGAKPIFVDIERETLGIDSHQIEEKITERTKAIMVVHLYGHPVDFDAVKKIALEHNLWVIEDAAEAHGALYKGKKVGSLGDVACFSFFGNKIITTGEGGIITTNDKVLANRMRFLRNQATCAGGNYYHTEVGFNCLMTNLQAAIGVAQLQKIKQFLQRKREIANLYNDLLQDVPLILPKEKDWAKSSFWMYAPILKENYPVSRDRLIKILRQKGVEARPFFVALPRLPFLQDNSLYPTAYEISERGINLPSGTTLTDEEINYVCEVVRNPLGRHQLKR